MNRTSNEILFDCEADILNNVYSHNTEIKIIKYISDYYFHEGREVNNNFSHDNWKGVACWIKTCPREIPVKQKDIPLFGRHSLRPDNFFLFLYVKYPWIGFLFFWIYLLFQVFDAIRMRKDQDNIPHTSGLILNYFVLQSFNFKLTFNLVSWLVRKNNYFKGWDKVFHRYYPTEHRVHKAYINSIS